MNSNIRNIIFDWGGVLLDLDVEGCIRAFEKAGATHIKEQLNGTNELGVFKDYECGKIDTPAFRREICRLTGTELPDAEIDRIWNSELLTIPQEKLELLQSLHSRYNLYLLSNTNELHWEHGSAYAFQYQGKDLKDCFKQIFLSFRMGLAKPDPAIFRTALYEAGLSAEETLFIDDAEINCQAAASVGIHTAHYIPGTDLNKIFE